MKLSNIFKKKSTSAVKLTNVQKLNTNQLEKVIGGAMGDPIPGVDVSLEQNPGSLRKGK